MEDLNFLRDMFTSLALLSAGVLLIVDWVKSIFKLEGVWVKVTSWVVALVASVIGMLAPYGMFTEFATMDVAWIGWSYTLLTGAAAALIANGTSSYEYVNSILGAIKTLFTLFVPKK